MDLKTSAQALKKFEDKLKRKLTWVEALAFKAGYDSREEDIDVLMTKIGLLQRMIPSDLYISKDTDREC